MRRQLATLILILLVLGPSSIGWAKQVVGWVEKVQVYPGGVTIKAKLDTGAKTSSLDCTCITPFKRAGKQWLSFSIKNHRGDIVRLEKPVVRTVRIKRHFGKEQVRYVVRLGICLGSVYRQTDVNLIDRTGFNYYLLVGRNFFKEDFLIDPSRTFLKSPKCPEAPK